MKKKFIIAILVGIVLIGGTTAVVAINNNSSNKIIKEDIVKTNEAPKEDVSSNSTNKEETKKTEDETPKEENYKKDKTLTKGDNNSESQENNQKKNIENNKEVSGQTNKNTSEKKVEVGQSLQDGYQLSYQARDAYENGDIDRAIEIYEKITNKDALAKTVDEKNMYYSARHINNEITKCEELYNSGDYMNARINIKELLGGNRMSEQQRERCRALIKKTDSKVGQSGESKLNNNFTYEKALEMLKSQYDRPNQEYKCLNEVIDSDGLKTFYIFQKDRGKDVGTLYMVNSRGKVQQTS